MRENKIISVDELWKFFNQSSSLFCIVNPDGFFAHTNPYFLKLLKFSEEDFSTKPLIDFVHPDDKATSRARLQAIQRRERIEKFQNRFLVKSGGFRWIAWTIITPGNDGQIYAVGQDISDNMLLQEQLIDQKLKKEKLQMEATISGQEMERVHIGRELHDNINQMLSTVKLYTELAMRDDNVNIDLLKKATELQMDAINEIRSLTRKLVVSADSDIDLTGSINDLVESTSLQQETKVNIQHSPVIEKMPAKIKQVLFRIIQEQLTNIAKYAKATLVDIGICYDSKTIRLSITDNGIGFDPSQKRNGIGLKNITSRAAIFDGQVRIESAVSKGCSLVVTIPARSVALPQTA